MIAYFLGGPLDLTKAAVGRAEPQLYALSRTAFTLGEIHTEQSARNAIDLIKSRHRYKFIAPAKLAGVNDPVAIYLYDGYEMDKP